MNRIFGKLRSRDGASMILAMVFLLFATFVGSSVLVSATANAYRVNHLSDQQDFLTERSAALVLTDELQLLKIEGYSEYLQVVITDTYEMKQQVIVQENGSVTPTGDPIPSREVSFKLATNDTDITEMQRLQLEATVLRYLNENQTKLGYENAVTVTLEGFPKHNNGTSKTDMVYNSTGGNFWLKPSVTNPELIQTSLKITGNTDKCADPVALPEHTVTFTMGADEDIYDITLDFGEFSQLSVGMNAFFSKPSTVSVNLPAEREADRKDYQKSQEITRTVISWDDPKIRKGVGE